MQSCLVSALILRVFLCFGHKTAVEMKDAVAERLMGTCHELLQVQHVYQIIVCRDGKSNISATQEDDEGLRNDNRLQNQFHCSERNKLI